MMLTHSNQCWGKLIFLDPHSILEYGALCCKYAKSIFKWLFWPLCNSMSRTFYPEYTLQPCAVLCQKGHMVWNSGSTFHQFWVGKKEKNSILSSHSLLAESRKTSSSALPIFLFVDQTSSKYLYQYSLDLSYLIYMIYKFFSIIFK